MVYFKRQPWESSRSIEVALEKDNWVLEEKRDLSTRGSWVENRVIRVSKIRPGVLDSGDDLISMNGLLLFGQLLPIHLNELTLNSNLTILCDFQQAVYIWSQTEERGNDIIKEPGEFLKEVFTDLPCLPLRRFILVICCHSTLLVPFHSTLVKILSYVSFCCYSISFTR